MIEISQVQHCRECDSANIVKNSGNGCRVLD